VAALLVVCAGAPAVQAQALVGLAVPITGATDVFPTTAWAQTPYELTPPLFPGDDDWVLVGGTVALDVTVPAGVTLGACAFDVTWTAGAFAFGGFDPDAVLFSSTATFSTPIANGVRVNAARLGDNATTGAGARLGTLRLTLSVANNATVQVAAVDCRAFDGVGGQTDVSVAPGPPARVGVLTGDVAARVNATTLDNTRGDGTVDFEDLQVLRSGYLGASDAASPTHTLYRLKLDIGVRPGLPPGADGLIDFEDLQLLRAQYGLTAF